MTKEVQLLHSQVARVSRVAWHQLTVPKFPRIAFYPIKPGNKINHVGEEEKTEIRLVSGETNLILHIETYQL